MKRTHVVNLTNRVQENSFNRGMLARKILSVLGQTLAGILVIFLGLLVVLLPLSTAVPAWIWIPLALADVGLIILPFRLKPTWRGVMVSLLGMIVVGLIAIFTSQVFAATPPITGADGYF